MSRGLGRNFGWISGIGGFWIPTFVGRTVGGMGMLVGMMGMTVEGDGRRRGNSHIKFPRAPSKLLSWGGGRGAGWVEGGCGGGILDSSAVASE